MEPSKKAVSAVELNFPRAQIGDRYELSKIIGKGSYGFVAEAKIKGTDVKVAIKKITRLFDDEVDAKRILRQIVILKNLSHPNLVKIIEIIPPVDFKTFNSIYVVTEYCQGDLRKVFKSQHIFLELSHIRSITYQILCGLKYLHSRDIIHRDLKPANVLINQDSSIKICDFGLARSMEGTTEEKEEQADEINEEDMSNILNVKKSSPPKEEQPPKEMSESDKRREAMKKKKGQGTVKMPKSGQGALTKELTIHVTTRWYRAPEVILLEKNYNAAIDIWSVGCIFGQLLKMMKETCPSVADRFPLFPGKYCYPLSPSKQETVQKGGFPHSKEDQLDTIFSTIGTPQEADLGFVTDAKAKDYLKSFQHQEKANLATKFPKVPKEAIDLLEKTIVFDPRKRLSVQEALAHPFFAPIRQPAKQTSGDHIKMSFEDEGELSEARLRELFIEEIKSYSK